MNCCNISRVSFITVAAFSGALALAAWLTPARSALAVLPPGGDDPVPFEPISLSPAKDGTLLDGGGFGDFDGVADAADWTFDNSGYEGSITLGRETPESSVAHRVVWEYSLQTVAGKPVSAAKLKFTLRGAAVYPMAAVRVNVYSYPADLNETNADFNSGPTVLQAVAVVNPFESSDHSVDVTQAVGAALAAGKTAIGFRFQIDPESTSLVSQAFIDAIDTDPSSKPTLKLWPMRRMDVRHNP